MMKFSRTLNISKSISAGLVAVVAAISVSTSTLAAPIVSPLALGPGDTYRLAFVTSAARDATSTDISDYNAFVTAVANSQSELAGLNTSWYAIASTDSVAARDNTGTGPSNPGVPIYLLDGSTRIADNNSDLWDGGIDNPLNIDETGSVAGGATGFLQVFAGTNPFNGLQEGGDTLGSASGVVWTGWTVFSDDRWTSSFLASAASVRSIYAISDEITIPAVSVPEPGMLALFCLGLAGLGFARRKRMT